MCGIVGMLSRRGPVSAATLQKATQSLHHRGPDGLRQWISPDRSVGLGHARLSIIDLTTGDQPIASEDGRKQSSTSFPVAPSLLGELLLGTHSLLHLQDRFLCSRATGDSRTLPIHRAGRTRRLLGWYR